MKSGSHLVGICLSFKTQIFPSYPAACFEERFRTCMLAKPSVTTRVICAKSFRYPVVLRTFNLNPGTGGDGRFRGGDGVIRETLFRKDLTLSVLTERRVYQPYGLNGVCARI